MARKERLKRSYMVMQDVGYELFADSVEAECSFGIRAADQALVRATLEELELFSYRARPSKYAFRRTKAATGRRRQHDL